MDMVKGSVLCYNHHKYRKGGEPHGAVGQNTLLHRAVVPKAKGVRSAEDRVAYLQEWGWQVAGDPTLVEELAMPEKFGEEYSQYLELQSAQGFNLAKYAGKRIKRYTFEVQNYPTGITGVSAHLLMYKNTVIGGEIMGDSFLHGLQVPQ